MLAYRSCASLTSERLPNKASASSKKSTRSPAAAASKMRSRFFSVSPMYLLTTEDRSTLYRSSRNSPATTSAASVLPVPDSPENRATTPVDGSGENPQLRYTSVRRRYRAVSSCRRAVWSAGSTRSCQPRCGWIRTASPSRWPPASRRTAGASAAGSAPLAIATRRSWLRVSGYAGSGSVPNARAVVGVRDAGVGPDLGPCALRQGVQRQLPRRAQHPGHVMSGLDTVPYGRRRRLVELHHHDEVAQGRLADRGRPLGRRAGHRTRQAAPVRPAPVDHCGPGDRVGTGDQDKLGSTTAHGGRPQGPAGADRQAGIGRVLAEQRPDHPRRGPAHAGGPRAVAGAHLDELGPS